MGPCLCGADDCPSCSPGCRRVVECERCREEFYLWCLDVNGLCESCAGKKQCEQCGEWFKPDLLNDEGYCDKCAKEACR